MHVQVVTFNLQEMTEKEFLAVCDEVAPAFAAAPGLLAKIWLADAGRNTYGGVYLWRDRTAMEEFATGDLFKAVASNPHFAGLTSRDFGTLDEYTRLTRGSFAVEA